MSIQKIKMCMHETSLFCNLSVNPAQHDPSKVLPFTNIRVRVNTSSSGL